MNRTFLIAAVAGIAAGYLFRAKLATIKPFSSAYLQGVKFAGPVA